MSYKIFFSNIGYAKGIDGSLGQHFRLFGRHFYAPQSAQQQVLGQVKAIIAQENPDLCCFVEIDTGSFHTSGYNQIDALVDDSYCHHDVAGKYGDESWLSRALFHAGKSNGFVAKSDLPFERLYFKNGTKRLIYRIQIPGNIDVFFAHFSLERKVREKQMQEIHAYITKCSGEAIVLADFNIMHGFSELAPLLEGGHLDVLNKESDVTFRFHRRQLALDLCLCSKSLTERSALKIIPQPYSDHAALLLEI